MKKLLIAGIALLCLTSDVMAQEADASKICDGVEAAMTEAFKQNDMMFHILDVAPMWCSNAGKKGTCLYTTRTSFNVPVEQPKNYHLGCVIRVVVYDKTQKREIHNNDEINLVPANVQNDTGRWGGFNYRQVLIYGIDIGYNQILLN